MGQNHTNQLISAQKKTERNIPKTRKKDLGIYLTNNINTVDKILNVVDFDDPQILNKKILEPSCGNGIFIIRLLEKLFNSSSDPEIVERFISSNIFFVDIDEEMISKTKSNISKFFKINYGKHYDGSYNAFLFDYTKRLKPKKKTLFEKIMDVPLSNYLEKIDYVIGNPPYVTLYGRRDRKKNEAQRVYYLNRYSQFPDSVKNGKINYVMLFIEQSVDLLKEGGKLSFIIDLAFFETAYKYTRKYLLERTNILQIDYNIKDFEVASGQIILKVEKGNKKNNSVLITDSESSKSIEINQSDWKTPNDEYKFRFNFCEKSYSIVQKVKNRDFPKLKQLYPKKNLRTCVMPLDMEDLFVFNEPISELNVKVYPYYRGSKSLPYRYVNMDSEKYFHYNKKLQDEINDKLKIELTKKGVKNKKRIGLGEPLIYDNPKVFIRQSAKELIASYDEKPSSANNSLYVFSLRDNSEESKDFLKFLCGLLNSKLMTFYAQQQNIIRYSKGKQPQIKISDLYKLPIPSDSKIESKISNKVNSIYLGEDIKEVMRDIDMLLYSYFEMSSNEIQTLENSIESF